MRKIFFILASVTTILIACSDSGNSSETKKDTTANTSSSGATDNSTPHKGLALVAKSGCFTCHKVAERSTGPSYQEVAARYPNNQAVVDSLSKKILHGGAGNWGTIPMTANAHVSEPDAKTMVEYILSLKQ